MSMGGERVVCLSLEGDDDPLAHTLHLSFMRGRG